MTRSHGRNVLDTKIRLEELLSQELVHVGVTEFELTWRSTAPENHHIDLRVFPANIFAKPFEFRLTLGTREWRRMRDFVVDSLKTVHRGIRVYLEICTGHQDVLRIAQRTAHAIRDIVQRFNNFGPHQLIGVRVHATRSRARLERIPIVERVRSHLRKWPEIEAVLKSADPVSHPTDVQRDRRPQYVPNKRP